MITAQQLFNAFNDYADSRRQWCAPVVMADEDGSLDDVCLDGHFDFEIIAAKLNEQESGE